MAIKSVVTSQTDFTGEFPIHDETVALWRFNESQPNESKLIDNGTNNHQHQGSLLVLCLLAD